MRSRVLVTLAVMAGLLLPLLGASAIAQASTTRAAVHPARFGPRYFHAAISSRAPREAVSTTKGTPNCGITPSPSSFVESGLGDTSSSVAYTLTVECKPVFGEEPVTIWAQQLDNACHGTLSWGGATLTGATDESATAILDDDGNATVTVAGGPSCAATRDLVTADLDVAPYTTATTHVVVAPPTQTPTGLKAYPSSEVEDSSTSSVVATFYAEFPSVYAEQTVEFSDPQLAARCNGNVAWYGADETFLGFGPSVTTTLDDDGNAFVVAFAGPSCASGTTLAQADLVGPTYRTLTTNFTILSPRVTPT
jgi:hypothetical protein